MKTQDKKEPLKRKHSHNCVLCGKAEDAFYTDEIRAKLIAKKYCHTCNFWDEHAERYEKDPDYAIRVGGKHYIICDEDPKIPHFCRGHGGATFNILHNDGRVITTTNLWHQGDIPTIFRNRMPDNAHFIPLIMMSVYREWMNAVLAGGSEYDPEVFCYLSYREYEDEWILGYNAEIGDGSIVYRQDKFYFRERISGEDREMSPHEALMMAKQCIG